MNEMEVEWKEFVVSKRNVLVLLLLAVIGSGLYVVYLERMGQLPSGYLEQYLIKAGAQWEWRYAVLVFWRYFKKCLLIWLLGLMSFMVPASIMLAYVYIFAYGFSITWLYVSMGISGLGYALLLFGCQGILMVIGILGLISGILEKHHVFKDKATYQYTSCLIRGGVICGIIMVLEMFVNM